jgi:hypothetical protein
MSYFGPLIDGSDVERALLAHLEYWVPSYIGQLRAQKDPDEELWPAGVSPIEDYTVRHAAADAWPGDRLPMLLAHCPNDGGEPWVSGEGKVQAKFAVALSAIAEGIDMADAKDLARLYGSAANMILLQKPDLSGAGEPFAADVEWRGYRMPEHGSPRQPHSHHQRAGRKSALRPRHLQRLRAGPRRPRPRR